MKMKAFTYMELIVVIALTGIVVSISYNAYMLVLKQQNGYLNKGEALGEIELLYTTLYKDVQQVKTIESIGSQLVFFPFQKEAFTYNFKTDLVIRKIKDKRDTFFVSGAELNATTLPQSSIVNQIELGYKILEDKNKLFIHKNYAVDTYLSIKK